MGRETLLAGMIDAACATIAERGRELDALDAAIGDGDHGTNLGRALTAVAARKEELARADLGPALVEIGRLLTEEAGGDGGRFYGLLFEGMGRAAPAGEPNLPAVAQMLAAGVAAVREAGGAAPGDKTMIDVLQPVADTLERFVAEQQLARLGDRVLAAAAHGLHRTSRLEARRGRAADLGTASVNHLDPGAWSATLLLTAVVSVLEGQQAAA